MKNRLAILIAASILSGTSVAQKAPLKDSSFPTADQRSLQMEMTVLPTFPSTLIANGITEGQARILISVDQNGVLTDWLTLAYTNELLANEAIDAIERWHFDPMLVRGQAMPCQVELDFSFQATGVVVSMSGGDAVKALFGSREEKLAYRPIRYDELDRVPIPVLLDAPVYPNAYAEEGISGSVTVEFFIDELGTVRMPAVVKSDHEVLSFLAIEAVQNWRFEPPTRNGRPALTRVRQRFDFDGRMT